MTTSSQPASLPASRFARFRQRLPRMREGQLFLLLAIIIGLLSGMCVVCFQLAIRSLRIAFLGSSLYPSWPRVVIAPCAAGLVVAVLALHVFPRVRGSGVNQTKAAVYIYDGFIPFKTAIGKFVTCSLAIGSGQSLGPEDPSLQIGAGIASVIGRKLGLSRDRVRLVAPIGAAAGLAAAFNAPITAVLFVIEEIIGNWSGGMLGAVILSAVSSSLIQHWFLGAEPVFAVPRPHAVNPSELIGYVVLGVVGGVASVVMSKLIAALRPRMRALPRWTQYLQPAIAGLLIGLIGIRFPQVMGAGYEAVEQAIYGQYTWQVLGILAGLKVLTTTASFVSGTPGGMFAPTLFIGAMLGASVAGVTHLVAPHLSGSASAYALVGMGTLFAGFLRAPMTSVFMILEVSGTYSIILAVMISNTIAYLIARALQPTPIFELLTQQDGLHLPSMEEQRERRRLRVEDAMRPALVPPLRETDPLAHALRVANDSNEQWLIAYNRDGQWLALRADEVRSAAASAPPNSTLDGIAGRRLPHLFPDNPLDVALHVVGDFAVVPVVHRADRSQLIGVVSLADVLAAYRRAGAE